MSPRIPGAGSTLSLADICFRIDSIRSGSTDAIRMCLLRLLKASMILLGALAVKINREVADSDSIIRRKYGCRFGPKWSASSITINRLTGVIPFSGGANSTPAGGGSSVSDVTHIERSNASKLVLPANVSLDVLPDGRRKSSNFCIAPAVPTKSRACNT